MIASEIITVATLEEAFNYLIREWSDEFNTDEMIDQALSDLREFGSVDLSLFERLELIGDEHE